MSAEKLREAARLMRERAEGATAGTWHVEDFSRNGHAPLIIGSDMAVAETFDKPHLSDAAHIASWGPPVAESVALLLETEALRADVRERQQRETNQSLLPHVTPQSAYYDRETLAAIAVASAYLNEVSS